jgi:Xaa-Pro aminopeptidase
MHRALVTIAFALLIAPPTSAQIPLTEYAQRRATLASQLEDGVFIARGAAEPVQDYMSFYQSAGFLYLTGYREAGAALVLRKRGGDLQWTLFVQEKDPAREVWSGRRYGPARAGEATGVDAQPVSRLRATLDSLLGGAQRLYVLSDLAEGGDTLNGDDRFVESIQRAHPSVQIVGANDLVTRMRSKKSEAELELIRRAAAISLEAHAEAARVLEPGMNEFEIQALLEYTFRRYGADRPGYASIVGSGPNSTILHYNRDDRFMQAGELLLIDAAALYAGYSADVTRTFPVSGTFTPAQREVYQVVRAAQARAESLAKPGGSWQAMGAAAREVIAAGLTRLGLIEAPDATYECGSGNPPRRCSQVSLYYMHGLGHGIGLAVHDPDQMYDGPIDVGSAFSIEPGIYVRHDLLDIIPDTPANQALRAKIAPAVRRYASVGVRIEDNYIVTPNGLEWISCVPREADEVEALMKEPVKGPQVRDAERVNWYKGTGVDPKDATAASVPKPRSCALPRV